MSPRGYLAQKAKERFALPGISALPLSLSKEAVMMCGGRSLVNADTTGGTAVTLFCRSWGCLECGERRKRELQGDIVAGHPNRFLTLTLRRSRANSPIEAAQRLARLWRLIVKRLRRDRIGELEYLCVFEPHKSGWPHLHIFIRSGWIDRQKIVEIAKEVEDSPIQDIRAIKDKKGAAVYASKYVTKENVRFGKSKRYWKSKNYRVEPREENEHEGGWQVDDRPLWKIEQDWTFRGFFVSRVDADTIRFSRPAWHIEYFPRLGP